MRYGEISSPTNASVPDVPALPIGVRPVVKDEEEEVVKERQITAEDSRVAELQILDKESFDPDSCTQSHFYNLLKLSKNESTLVLKAKLANSTEAEIRSLETTLQNSKAQTDDDLRKNVFKK